MRFYFYGGNKMITPLEIENKRFTKKTINGYSPDEVDDFLDELTKDYEKLYKNYNENGKKVEHKC
jgi:cell division initiation protein